MSQFETDSGTLIELFLDEIHELQMAFQSGLGHAQTLNDRQTVGDHMNPSTRLLLLSLLPMTTTGFAQNPKTAQTYSELVNKCVAKIAAMVGEDQAAKRKAMTLCMGGSTKTIVVKNGVATITTQEGGKTTVEQRTVKKGEDLTVGHTTITTKSDFRPSPFALKVMGKDFDWKDLGIIESKELSDCVTNFKCDANAYLEAKKITAYHSDALELSRCVMGKQCDLKAYLRVHAVNGYFSEALELSKCAAQKVRPCDASVYVGVYKNHPYHSEAFEMAKCVADEKCNYEAYLQVFAQTTFYGEALEVAKCVKAHKCSLSSYLQAYSISLRHEEALKISKSFTPNNQTMGQNAGTAE